MAWLNDLHVMQLLACLLAIVTVGLAAVLSRRSGTVAAAEAAARQAQTEAQAAGLRAAEATARLDGQLQRLAELGAERDEMRAMIDRTREQSEALAR